MRKAIDLAKKGACLPSTPSNMNFVGAWFYLACLLGPRLAVCLALVYYVVPPLVLIAGLALLIRALAR